MANENMTDEDVFKRALRMLRFSVPLYLLFPLISDVLSIYSASAGPVGHSFNVRNLGLVTFMIPTILTISLPLKSFKKRIKYYTLLYWTMVPCLFAGSLLVCVIRGYEIPWLELSVYFAIMATVMYFFMLGLTLLFCFCIKEGEELEEKSGKLKEVN